MKKQSNLFVLSLVAAGLALASTSQAASTLWSSTAPTIDGADIANFTGAATKGDNTIHPDWGAGDDEGTYVAGNRPAQGQTFITGSDAGYSLNAITLQHVAYDTYWSLDDGWTGYNGGRFQLQIGTIDGILGFIPIATEDAYMDASAPPNMNPGPGSAYYVSLTLDSPVALAANSAYAFALTTTADFNPWESPYFELNGNGASGTYADGEAFVLTGTPGGQDQTGEVLFLTGDRVFHLDMTVVPEPSAGLLAISGLGLLLGLRRRRS